MPLLLGYSSAAPGEYGWWVEVLLRKRQTLGTPRLVELIAQLGQTTHATVPRREGGVQGRIRGRPTSVIRKKTLRSTLNHGARLGCRVEACRPTWIVRPIGGHRKRPRKRPGQVFITELTVEKLPIPTTAYW